MENCNSVTHVQLKFSFKLHSVDESDNEEINELSQLQDPANQNAQVGGSINVAEADKNNLNSPGGNAQVPSDQKESGSDGLANITDFLKNKEGTTTDPGRH